MTKLIVGFRNFANAPKTVIGGILDLRFSSAVCIKITVCRVVMPCSLADT